MASAEGPAVAPISPGTAHGTAYDELYALDAGPGSATGGPWIFTRAPLDADVARTGLALQRLTDAAAADPSRLSDTARVVLQNDVWGLAHRLERAGQSSEPGEGLRRAAWRLVGRLALPEARLVTLDGRAMSPAVRDRLPPADGWTEVASEMPVLSHENAFGMRRIFRLAQRGDEIALFSQLVAIDEGGRARLTSVAGEIEALTMGPEGAVAARVWELDRRALSTGSGHPLSPVETVEHVPSVGADDFLDGFDPPARVADLPCFSCHHDTSLQALPAPELDPGWRWPSLLEQASQRIAS